MPAEILLDYQAKSSVFRKMQFQVVFQCAPVLKGVKASNLITIPKGFWSKLKREWENSKIRWICLASGRENDVVLLYREKWLVNLLGKAEVMAFLEKYGYTVFNLEPVLSRLACRYAAYSMGECGFPHELGIFLQYPLRDVEAFIENEGKNSLFTGYWKVYHNPGEARRVFGMYDRVREKAAREFMSGFAVEQIIV